MRWHYKGYYGLVSFVIHAIFLMFLLHEFDTKTMQIRQTNTGKQFIVTVTQLQDMQFNTENVQRKTSAKQLNLPATPEKRKKENTQRQKQANRNIKSAHKFNNKDVAIDKVLKTQQKKTISDNALQQEKMNYETQLINWLMQNSYYPSQAKSLGQEGGVLLSFSLDPKGNLVQYEIKQNSEFEILTQAAVNILLNANPFPPIPKNLTKHQVYPHDKVSFVVPIEFNL